MTGTDTDRGAMAGRLLGAYRMWGISAILAFIFFLGLLTFFYISSQDNPLFLFGILMSGFLWIGMTSLSRHTFVMLKQYIGSEVSMAEFISTQMVVVLFPFSYIRLKKEVALFRAGCDKHLQYTD